MPDDDLAERARTWLAGRYQDFGIYRGKPKLIAKHAQELVDEVITPAVEATASVLEHATAFQFLLYPEGHEFWDIAELAVTVEWRGGDRWAVKMLSFCYDANGHKEYESIPSDREDEFLARFRFSRDEAVRIAREVAVPAERARWDARFERKANRGASEKRSCINPLTGELDG